MNFGEFTAWVAAQERKHELVDGEPRLMAGASRRHDRIARNALVVLDAQLRGRKGQPFTSDTFVRIPAGNARLPDLGVDCGPFDDTALEAAEPALVVEILSPTTQAFDRTEKLEEYKTVGSLEYILLIDPDQPQARLYARDAERRWASVRIAGLDAVIAMPVIGVSLPLAELYRDLRFQPKPMPIDTEPSI